MSSFHYGGPRNVLCTPALMSRDVRIQLTPEPTLGCIHFLLSKQEQLRHSAGFGNRASVRVFGCFNAVP
jgi:hypothetical protein